MFGKTKEHNDIHETTEIDDTVEEFFGDETAVAEAARVDQLHQRVTQVEQQISSQFTSLAAYAQIAQEQVELVRSEAQHANERSEQRVVGLIERERADRMSAEPGGGTDVTARLDSLDAQIAELRDGLQQCLSNQKALADAITHLFTNADDAAAPAAPPAAPPTPSPDPAAPEAAPAIESAAPAATLAPPAQQETLPPPPASAPSLEDLDHELHQLGVSVEDGLADVVSIAPVDVPAELLDGPIDGLSLA